MSEHGDFYVGYLPMPRRLVVFLWITVPLLAGGLGTLAAVFSASQRDPGSGVWDTDAPITVEGTLLVEPYAMIVDDSGATFLLVEIGKSGAADRAAPFAGERVAAQGFELEREGRKMLELIDGEAAFVRTNAPARPIPVTSTGETVTLSGEILDSKCYLGAMKPGDGKGHKACATLCITGGVPPLLRIWAPDGSARHLLLVDSDGTSARDDVLAWIGEPVVVTGKPGRIGDMETLAVGAGSVVRLGL